MLDMVNETSVIEGEDVTYLYLPLAHSFALLIQLGSFDLGATIAYWERDPLKILPNLAELKPTYFPSVPRIFEKIYTAATSGMEKEGGLKKAIFDWAIKVGAKMREVERSGRKPGFLLPRQYKFADEKVLSKIRDLFGGQLRLAVSGAAPINPEILRFFDAAGVLVLEGWGMTETSTAATISTPDDFKIGTIGKPFPGCEVRIADDGEILVKGPNVFQGYHKNEEATRETIVDGWLHTGDIGEIDSDGFIKITGRKKDIIITAGGKNITPANLEADIKQHPLVSQCVVVGDRRPYLVALVTLDPEEAVAYAKEHDLPEDPAAARRQRRRQGLDRGPRREDQQELRPGRAGQEDLDPPPRPLAGERRADADAEGEAGGRRREARGRDRGALRGVAVVAVAGWEWVPPSHCTSEGGSLTAVATRVAGPPHADTFEGVPTPTPRRAHPGRVELGSRSDGTGFVALATTLQRQFTSSSALCRRVLTPVARCCCAPSVTSRIGRSRGDGRWGSRTYQHEAGRKPSRRQPQWNHPTRCSERAPTDRLPHAKPESGSLARLPQQHRRRLLEHPPPGRGLLRLFLGSPARPRGGRGARRFRGRGARRSPRSGRSPWPGWR